MRNFPQMSAAQLLEACGISSPPVDLDRIIRFLGIEVNVSPDFNKLDISLESYPSHVNNSLRVWLNPFEYRSEQRFSLAHEIGYLMITYYDAIDYGRVRRQGKNFYGNGYLDYHEHAASEYASDLLMPSQMVQRYGQDLIHSYNYQHQGLMGFPQFSSQMAQLFDVSQKAMEIRLTRLGVTRM